MKSTFTAHLDGSKEWCLGGNYHRDDGPAFTRPNGDEYWYLRGKLHREDGPAATVSCGGASFEYYWYLYGQPVAPFTKDQAPLVLLSVVDL